MTAADKFCTRRVSELIPYENNPRNNKRAVDAVAECIRRFGFRGAVVIDANNVIVCGHTRVEAAKKLGMDTLPCEVITDLTESEIRAYRLADNKTAELANWRDDLLAAELDAVSEIDMSLFGFDPAKLGGVVEDEFDPDPPALPFSQDGDIYVLGRHRLIVGNACDQNVIARLMDGSKVDMYLTDPPYNVDYKGTAGVIKNDNMGDEAFGQFLRDAFLAADSVMKAGAVFYIWHSNSEGFNFYGACRAVNWPIRQCLIWVKNRAVLSRQDYNWRHEPCLYGWKDGGRRKRITLVMRGSTVVNRRYASDHEPCLYGWKDGAKHLWHANHKQNTVLEYDRPMRSKDHPTMKPVLLFDALIQNSTREGEIVFDSFAGSGTTLAACEQNGRLCYCSELDPRFADVIVRRYIELVGDAKSVSLLRGGKQFPLCEVEGSEALYAVL